MEDEDERNRKDDEDKLLDELAAQGMHKNLSFFAFTATPKGKTLQLFGQKDAEGIYRPFHIYSMRQAIEEHFILDVLQNYMTYKMYYKIAKIIEDNPEFDTTAGSKAIINYETLHPHNISQKTAIMLEHFMNVTRHKIGGRAKAMVVTPSRLHAVRYVQEFKRQIKEKGLNDLEVLPWQVLTVCMPILHRYADYLTRIFIDSVFIQNSYTQCFLRDMVERR